MERNFTSSRESGKETQGCSKTKAQPPSHEETAIQDYMERKTTGKRSEGDFLLRVLSFCFLQVRHFPFCLKFQRSLLAPDSDKIALK